MCNIYDALCRMTTSDMLAFVCKPDGFEGFCGGIKELCIQLGLHKSQFVSRAAQHGVLLCGGNAKKDAAGVSQYSPNKFGLPILQAAIAGGALNACMLVVDAPTKKGMFNSSMIGDWKDLMLYLKNDHMVDRNHRSVFYWHSDELSLPVRCYVDLDVYLDTDDPTAGIEVLRDVVMAVTEKLENDYESKDVAKVITSTCVRPAAGKFKHSFHCTWPRDVFDTVHNLKLFMSAVKSSNDKLLIDLSVYNKTQLMRTPWTPKGGKKGNEMRAVMLPMVSALGGKIHQFDSEYFELLHIKPSAQQLNDKTYHHHTVSANRSAVVRTSTVADDIYTDVEKYERSKGMLEFFKPLMSLLVGKIQAHRRARLSLKRGAGAGAGVPVGKHLVVSSPKYQEMDVHEGVWTIKVAGDTFCEYDAPNHYHSTGDKICISLNLQSGYYSQLCHACNPSGDALVRHALWGFGGNIEPTSYDPNTSVKILDVQGKHGVVMFLQSLEGNVLYHPSFGSTVYVYDEKSKLWVNDAAAVQQLTKNRNEYRALYNTYCRCAGHADYAAAMSSDLTPAKKAKCTQSYIALCTRDPNKDLQGAVFMENIVNAYSSAYPEYTEAKLNGLVNLVPMNDGTCFDVLSGETVVRTKEMQFTSMMSVARKQEEDEECVDVRAWFLEVCGGVEAQAQYLQRIVGYCATGLVDDRRFYVNQGIGRNGKGVLHKFLKVLSLISPISHISHVYIYTLEVLSRGQLIVLSLLLLLLTMGV